MKDLNAEEREALQAYAKRHGRTWKNQLRLAWERASLSGTLHALRNDPGFGPAGLERFRRL